MPGPSAFEPPHIILPTALHTHTIIALHGRGSQGPEFAEELFEAKTSSGLTLQETYPSWKWVFPSSQERYSTVFQEDMDEWFDIYSLTHPSKREELQVEGLRDSINFIRRSIIEEADIVTTDHVTMLGLSLGSAIGLFTLLASQMKIGAYVGLNGWIPFETQIEKATLPGWRPSDLAEFFNTTLALEIPTPTDDAQSFLKTPVFLGHTIDDEVMPTSKGCA